MVHRNKCLTINLSREVIAFSVDLEEHFVRKAKTNN